MTVARVKGPESDDLSRSRVGIPFRQSFWSAASSAAALLATTIPTWGAATVGGSAPAAALVLALWLGAIIAAVTSIGLPAIAGTAVAEHNSLVPRDSWGIPVAYAKWWAGHAVAAGIVGLVLGLGARRLDLWLDLNPIVLAIVAAATATQSSGNSLLSGALRNEAIFLGNVVVALGAITALTAASVVGVKLVLPLLAVALALRIPVTLFYVSRLAAKVDSGSRHVRKESKEFANLGSAYIITLVSVLGFQRLEAPFLSQRSTATDLAVYGIAFDAAQVTRGLAVAPMGVLLPLLVRWLHHDRGRATDITVRIAVLSTGATALMTLSLFMFAPHIPLVERLMQGNSTSDVAGVLASTSATTGVTVFGSLLLADRQFQRLLAVLMLTLATAALANFVLTDSLGTASLVQVLVAVTFAALSIALSRATLAISAASLFQIWLRVCLIMLSTYGAGLLRNSVAWPAAVLASLVVIAALAAPSLRGIRKVVNR